MFLEKLCKIKRKERGHEPQKSGFEELKILVSSL